MLTIDNKKNTIILKAKSEGNAILTIETEAGSKLINIVVTSDKTTLSDVDGFTYFQLDKVGKWNK
jgi:hypothetical protein